MNMAATKNGTNGILNLTNAPKFGVDIPIIKPNMTENNMHMSTKGLPVIIRNRYQTLVRHRM